jgi:hypothetical protein
MPLGRERIEPVTDETGGLLGSVLENVVAAVADH